MKDAWFYKVIQIVLTPLTFIFLRPKMEGLENIPKKGRVILAGTHTNNLDCCLLISATKRNVHFLAKKELWKGPKKIIFGNAGLIPVDRKNKDHNALALAEDYLNSDLLIGIFPEGTTQQGRGLLPFKIGAVKMAKDTNSPIVPFIITGKYRLFSKDLKIKFLKPIKITKDLERENERLRNIIKRELDEKK